jgi:hypothetical protein
MFLLPWVVVAALLLFVASVVILGPSWRRKREAGRISRARRLFHQRREWLEADFLTIVSRSGKPRGLNWADCEFDDGLTFARDKHSGQLRALVGVTVRFEAEDGGGASVGASVSNLRAATAVFRFDGVHWKTDGRAIFNLNPAETLQRFQHELETME